DAIAGLHQGVVAPADVQRALHPQGVERELLQVLAVAVAVGPHARRTGIARAAWHERRAQMLRGIGERLVRLDLRQRLHAAGLLLLRLGDEAAEVLVLRRTAGRQ